MDSFVTAIEQHRDQFYRFVLRNVWDTSSVDDVFASAVLTAFEHRAQFIPGTNFRAWMYRILANKCFVANRETLREGTPLDEEAADALPALSSPLYSSVLNDSAAFLEQCGEEVFCALRRLSTAQRMCILLKDVDRFSLQETAEIMGIPTTTVITHLGRGRARLRKDLLDYAKRQGIVGSRPNMQVPMSATLAQGG